MSDSSDYAWLLDRLAKALGVDVARGTLDSALAALDRTPRNASRQDFREVLRGPLRERLRLSLGKRAAVTWTEQAERERFGPDLAEAVPPQNRTAGIKAATTNSGFESGAGSRAASSGSARSARLGRRAGDLALALAQLRVETAQRGLERLQRDRETTPVWRLAAEHTVELAQAELRRLENQERLVGIRGDHLRRETWLEAVLARHQRQVLALAFNETNARHAAGEVTPRELSEARFALRQARDLVEGLEALGVPEVELGGVPRVPPTDPQPWLPFLEGHPDVRRARHATEITRLRAEQAAHPDVAEMARADLARAEQVERDAREVATEELHARLATIRTLGASLAAWESATVQAAGVLERHEQQASSELDRERARLEYEQRRAVLLSTGHRMIEAEAELRLLLGGGPSD